MVQGVSSSLNMALARISYIENSFSALEKLSAQNSPMAENINNFQKVLDEKKVDAKVNEIVEKKPVEKTIELPKIDDEIKPQMLEAINLKSKIDLASQSNNIDEIIETFSDKYNIDSDFIKAIIKQESGFNPNATSKKGAMGLMQLMPKTAESLGVLDAYNPSQNVEGGVKYLKSLLDKYDNNQELALAAYNAGPGAVQRYGGVPPYKETQNYIKSIMATYNKVKEANI